MYNQPQPRPATGGSLSLPHGGAPGGYPGNVQRPPRSMGSMGTTPPAASAAVRVSASPQSHGIVRMPSGGVPQGTPPASRGGSVSIKPAVPQQSSGSMPGPSPRAFQSLGTHTPPGAPSNLGQKATPFAIGGQVTKKDDFGVLRTPSGPSGNSAPNLTSKPVSYRSDTPTQKSMVQQPHWAATMEKPPEVVELDYGHSLTSSGRRVPPVQLPGREYSPPAREERSTSPELPVSHRYPQARVEYRSPALRQLEPQIEPAPARGRTPSPPMSLLEQHRDSSPGQQFRGRYEEPVVIKTTQPQYFDWREAPQPSSPAGQPVIPNRLPASAPQVQTPSPQRPPSNGFLSSLSSDPVHMSPEKPPQVGAFRTSPQRPAEYQQTQGRQPLSSHYVAAVEPGRIQSGRTQQEPQRGIEFQAAPKPIWQRDEVVAPVLLTAPLAGFLSTMLF